MKPNLLFIVAAVYLGLVGIGFSLSPNLMIFTPLPSGIPDGLIAELRQYGGALIGIAVLNWLSRNAEASRTKDAIFAGNIVGFGLVALGGVVRQMSGAIAVGWVFVLVNALFAVAFFVARRAGISDRARMLERAS
jgi:hypothetical protein